MHLVLLWRQLIQAMEARILSLRSGRRAARSVAPLAPELTGLCRCDAATVDGVFETGETSCWVEVEGRGGCGVAAVSRGALCSPPTAWGEHAPAAPTLGEVWV